MKRVVFLIAAICFAGSGAFALTTSKVSDSLMENSMAGRKRFVVNATDSSVMVIREFYMGNGVSMFRANSASSDTLHQEKVGRGERRGRSSKVQRPGSSGEVRVIIRNSADSDTLSREIKVLRRMEYSPELSNFHYRGHRQLSPDRLRSVGVTIEGMQSQRQRNENSINLTDRSVISYKKRSLSGGREKITIIRKKPLDSEEVQIIDRRQQLLSPQRPVRELNTESAPGDYDRRIRIKIEEPQNEK